jgi:hypothetical protein
MVAFDRDPDGDRCLQLRWIQSATVHVDILEDRILLDCSLWSGQRVMFWITRRLSDQLVFALAKHAEALSRRRVTLMSTNAVPNENFDHHGLMHGDAAVHSDHFAQQAKVTLSRESRLASQLRPTQQQIVLARKASLLCTKIAVNGSGRSLYLRFQGEGTDIAALDLSEPALRFLLGRLSLLYNCALWGGNAFPNWVLSIGVRGERLN